MFNRSHDSHSLSGHRKRRSAVLIALVAIGMMLMTMGFIIWPLSPPELNLKDPHSADVVSLLERWRKGEVAVLIRHAERCDRSSNPCLGPADGITRLGSVESERLGNAYAHMDLSHTDVLASPITRTAQTARFMFAAATPGAQWLADCGATLRADVVAHKHAGRNLIMVTHSGCISDFEKQTGFKHAATSEYNSSLFVGVAADGTVNVMGIANMTDWPTDVSFTLQH